MHWQVDYCYVRERCGELRAVGVYCRPVGFRWWVPMDYVRWFSIFRHGFTTVEGAVTKCYTVSQPVETMPVMIDLSQAESLKLLPPGTRIRARRGIEVDRLDLIDVIVHLPDGGEIDYTDDEIPF